MSTKLARGGFWNSLKEDVTRMRQMRFAFGVTFSCALAYGVDWPLSFLLPIFSCVLLALPLPKPSVKASLQNMLNTLKAFALGLLFSIFFLQYPSAYILALGLVLFHIYYYLNRGGSFWLTLMSLIAVLILPMIAQANTGLAFGFAAGFIYSSWLTIAIIWLVHFVFPDPKFTAFPTPPGFQKKYVPNAAQAALKSALVTLPVATIFITFGLIDYLLVMVFSAMFILKPELSAGLGAGKNSMISTLLGGAYAAVFYWLMVAVPQYHFFLLLLLATTLFFARNIFSTKSTAKYYSSALIAMLVVFNSSMAAGASFNDILFNRIILISMAIAYIVIMLNVLEHFGIGNAKAEVKAT
ncbi:DUF2955 domain-containing protein [Psychromonas sp. psych-6C06]|uniref:DUF2955 domain-containing protein n=1 Tax=Psychromonas sp. psych-6C06 TaxID=2058089 RepID=UPI001EE76615|nr:DUF2955 domain-containing protein [Psychromonas sp. psych-6C06]